MRRSGYFLQPHLGRASFGGPLETSTGRPGPPKGASAPFLFYGETSFDEVLEPSLHGPMDVSEEPAMSIETTRSLTRKQAEKIIKASFPEYKGRKIQLELTDKVTFSDTNWGGGSRNRYAAIAHDGRTDRLDFSGIAPWRNPIEGRTIDLPPGVLIVEHTIFCGKDCGLRLYLNPASAGTLALG